MTKPGTSPPLQTVIPPTKEKSAKLLRRLDWLRQTADADVVVFYWADDPFVPSLLRAFCEGAARYPEACSLVRRLGTTNETQAFFEQARADPLAVEVATTIRGKVLSHPLGGDFISREEIVSRGWFLLGNAWLTVNYRQPLERQRWQELEAELAGRFRDLVKETALEYLYRRDEMDKSLVSALFELQTRLDPLLALPHSAAALTALPVWKHAARQLGLLLRDVLADILRPMILPGVCQAALYFLDDSAGVLHPLAATTTTQSLRVTEGEGTASWVALRRQILLLDDLAASSFQSFGGSLLPDARSILVVPLLAQNQLYGTLILEAAKPQAFCWSMVGYLLRAANLLAARLMSWELTQTRGQRDLYQKALHQQLARNAPADLAFPDPSELPPEVPSANISAVG